MIAVSASLPASARPLQLARRQDITAESLVVRGQKWWRLKDPVRLKFWQLGDEEYFLWSRITEETSLDDLQHEFSLRFAPRQIERTQLHHFLGTLHREGLAFSTVSGQAEVLLDREQRQRVRAKWSWMANLLAVRFRGIDPSRLIEWLYGWTSWLFASWSLAALALFVMSAGLLAVSQVESLVARLPKSSEFLAADNFVWLAVALALLKVCHELGHALTCRHFGGRCHELGVLLLVFTPCLYCNVSDAWLLPSKWRRMAISAAGMGVELVLAAAATWVWWFSEPGLFSSLCFNVMVVGTVNTLLFNGNPLLKFDSYFLVSDWLEIPNLRQISDEWLRRKLSRLILGREVHSNPLRITDRPYVVAVYAVTSLLYRTCLTCLVWWLVYQWFARLHLAAVGAFVVLLSASVMFTQSFWTGWQTLTHAWRSRKLRAGRATAAVLIASALTAGTAIVPCPERVTAPVMLRPADAVVIFVSSPGTLREGVAAGESVAPGMVLARLSNDDLERELLQLTAEQDGLQSRLEILSRQRVVDTRPGIAGVAGQLATVEKQLSDVQAQLAQKLADRERLILRAPRAGTVIPVPQPVLADRDTELQRWSGSPLDPRNLGCLLEPGDVLCQIGDPQQPEAVVLVRQSDVGRLQVGQTTTVQLDELPGANLTGRVLRIASSPIEEAPGELLAKRRLAVGDSSGGMRLVETYYPVTVQLDSGRSVPVGATGCATIHVPPRPLGLRVYSAICGVVRW